MKQLLPTHFQSTGNSIDWGFLLCPVTTVAIYVHADCALKAEAPFDSILIILFHSTHCFFFENGLLFSSVLHLSYINKCLAFYLG